MNERIRKLAEQSGLNIPLDAEYNGHIYRHALEKFAELIIQECIACCGSQADIKNIRKRFGLPSESNVKYPGPESQGHLSQYSREYNIPKLHNIAE